MNIEIKYNKKLTINKYKSNYKNNLHLNRKLFNLKRFQKFNLFI